MEKLIEGMAEELVIWAAILATLVAVAFYVIGRLRSPPSQQEPTANELLSKLREMHLRGELSDQEFRTIKTTLAAPLQEELKDNGEKG